MALSYNRHYGPPARQGFCRVDYGYLVSDDKDQLRTAVDNPLRKVQLEGLRICRYWAQGRLCNRYAVLDADVRNDPQLMYPERQVCHLRHPRFVKNMDVLKIVQCHKWARGRCDENTSRGYGRCRKLHSVLESMANHMEDADRSSHLWIGESPTFQMTMHLLLGDNVESSFRGSRALCSPLYFPVNDRAFTAENDGDAMEPTSSQRVPAIAMGPASSESVPSPAAPFADSADSPSAEPAEEPTEDEWMRRCQAEFMAGQFLFHSAPHSRPLATPRIPLGRMDLVDRMNLDLQQILQESEEVIYGVLMGWRGALRSAESRTFGATPRTREYMQNLVMWIEDNLALLIIPEKEEFRQAERRARWC